MNKLICRANRVQNYRNVSDFQLPESHTNSPATLEHLSLQLIGPEHLTDFSVKQQNMKDFSTLSWQSLAVSFLCALLLYSLHNMWSVVETRAVSCPVAVCHICSKLHKEVLQCSASSSKDSLGSANSCHS